jgi:hypothetical protein
MCVGVEFFENGEPRRVYVSQPDPHLPVKLRDGAVVMVKWGAGTAKYRVDDNTPGRLFKFPPEGWARLDSVRADEWRRYNPRPVKIAVARFVEVDSMQVPHWIDLKPGQYLQGLRAQIGEDRRVYVVTIPAPEVYRHISDRWPRVVGTEERPV